MTAEQLRSARDMNPFQPFTLRLVDGRSVRVPHRDFLSIAPSGRMAIVYAADDSYKVIDLPSVIELSMKRRSRRRKDNSR